MTNNSLQQFKILLLRQLADSEPLANAIKKLGGLVYQWPALEIKETKQQHKQQIIDLLSRAQKHIFISKPAAFFGLSWIKHIANPEVYSVGEATAAVLTSSGIKNVVFSSAANSEGLLELSQLQQVNAETVVIYKGDKGREILQKTLQNRGAEVFNLRLYSRETCVMSQLQAQTLKKFAANSVQITSETAAVALDNANQRFKLFNKKKIKILVISKRLEGKLKKMGYHNVYNINTVSNEAFVTALKQM